MPLQKRVTEPVHICRGILPEESTASQTQTLRRTVPNELECVTNGTLANVIRQLSSLSKHAEDLFGELYYHTVNLVQRTNSLQGRIDRLAVKVTQLDSNVEEVSLQDIHLRKAFKSTTIFEQQVVSRESIPAAMLETYNQCDRPPPLDKLNPYRDDGKNGLKFYTDPNYFFELWRQEMLKDTERMEKIMQDKGRNRPHRPKTDGKGSHRKFRQPQNTREMFINRIPKHEIYDQNMGYGNVQGQMRQGGYQQGNHYDPGQQPPLRPNSLELHPGYDPQSIYGRNGVTPSSGNYHPQAVQPNHIEQPPYSQWQPPPPYTATSDANPYPYTISRKGSQGGSTSRPVHPPPAPPSGGSGSSTPVLGPSQSGTPVRKPQNRESLPPPPPPPNDSFPNGPIPSHLHQKGGPMLSRSSTPGSPTSLNATPTHNQMQQAYNQMSGGGGQGDVPEQGTPDSMDLPPPPPTPDKDFPAKIPSEDMPSPPPPSTGSTGSSPPVGVVPAPPPPPPPPPLPALSNGPIVANGDVGKPKSAVMPDTMGTNSPKVSTTKMAEGESRPRMHAQLPHIPDARSDLLAAIREGIKLRKVEDNKQKEVDKHTAPHDVASILARRVAMEFSDSDTEEESEYDSEAWDDDGST